MTRYDAVYYWSGGRERGEWRFAPAGDDYRATVASIRRGGRVAFPGKVSIGAPEGPPSEADFKMVEFHAAADRIQAAGMGFAGVGGSNP